MIIFGVPRDENVHFSEFNLILAIVHTVFVAIKMLRAIGHSFGPLKVFFKVL